MCLNVLSPWAKGTTSPSWNYVAFKSYLVSPKHENMDCLSRDIQKPRLKSMKAQCMGDPCLNEIILIKQWENVYVARVFHIKLNPNSRFMLVLNTHTLAIPKKFSILPIMHARWIIKQKSMNLLKIITSYQPKTPTLDCVLVQVGVQGWHEFNLN